jgi:hypothetical protein
MSIGLGNEANVVCGTGFDAGFVIAPGAGENANLKAFAVDGMRYDLMEMHTFTARASRPINRTDICFSHRDR